METKIRTRFAVHKSFNPHKLILYRFKILIILITTLLNYKTLAQTPQWEFMGLAGEEVFDIATDDSGYIYIGSNGGVFKTTDNGGTWIFKNNGLQVGLINKIFIDYEGNIFIGATSFPNTGCGLYKSTDGGEYWAKIADTLNSKLVNEFYDITIIPNEIGGIMYASNYYGIHRSTDNGITWQSTNFTDPGARNIGKNTNGYMFFGNDFASWFGLYRSTDLGLNWDRHTFLGVTTLVYLAGGSVLASAYDPGLGSCGIYKTTDDGLNWLNTNTFSGLSCPIDFVVYSNDDIYASAGYVYLTNDNGISWLNYGLPGQGAFWLATDLSGYIWSGNHLDGVYRTATRIVPVELSSFSIEVINENVLLTWVTATEMNNQGFQIERRETKNEEWINIGFVNGNVTTTEPQAYSFVDKNLETGKYQYRLKQIDFDGSFEYSNIVEVEVGIPFEFFLSQNYPNPFNPSTIIKYSLKDDGKVSLKIFNSLGEEVRTLVNEIKPAGNYEVEFNASNLPSDVYIYQLTTPGFTQARKMILAK